MYACVLLVLPLYFVCLIEYEFVYGYNSPILKEILVHLKFVLTSLTSVKFVFQSDLSFSFVASDNLITRIKDTVQTNSSSTILGWVPSNAVDDSPFFYPDICCCFASDNEANSWWQIDLGEAYSIHGFEVFSRADIDIEVKDQNRTRPGSIVNSITLQSIPVELYKVSV